MTEEDTIEAGAAGASDSTDGTLLVCIPALDIPGTLDHRLMAKMLAGSLLRNYFEGTVRIYRNTPEPIFRLLREGLEEWQVDTAEFTAVAAALELRQPAGSGVLREELAALRTRSGRWKAEILHAVEDGWGTVLHMDADCVALRSIEHLIEGSDWDIRWLPAPGSRPGGAQASSAVLAVRHDVCRDVMQEWMREMDNCPAGCRRLDDTAWTEVIRKCRDGQLPWRTRRFEPHEIVSPLAHPEPWHQYREAAVLHAGGRAASEKIEFLFGAYMQRYFSDNRGTLLNILEM